MAGRRNPTRSGWTRRPDGTYTKGQHRIRKERVVVRGRGIQDCWALYDGSRLQAHHRTLKAAKKAAGPIGSVPWLGNPRRKRSAKRNCGDGYRANARRKPPRKPVRKRKGRRRRRNHQLPPVTVSPRVKLIHWGSRGWVVHVKRVGVITDPQPYKEAHAVAVRTTRSLRKNPGRARNARRRRNEAAPTGALGGAAQAMRETHGYKGDDLIRPHTPKTPREQKVVRRLGKIYKDHHWGAPGPLRIMKVNDPLVPNVVAMGKLDGVKVKGHGDVDFPPGCWVAWDPKHPRKRLHLVLTRKARGELRNGMKHVGRTEKLSRIAKRAGGKGAKHRYPNVKAVDLGPSSEIRYSTFKKGDSDHANPPGSGYFHEFGKDGMGGHKPHLAVDVSGRPHLVGGDVSVKEAGIVG